MHYTCRNVLETYLIISFFFFGTFFLGRIIGLFYETPLLFASYSDYSVAQCLCFSTLMYIERRQRLEREAAMND